MRHLPTQLPRLRLRGPGDLLAVLPYLLGFHPRDSLVLVGLAGGNVVVTARLDLADAGSAATLAQCVGLLRRADAREVLAVLVDDGAPVTGGLPALPHELVVETLERELVGAGMRLLEALLVAAGRYWSYCCADPGCCPAEGTPVPTGDSPVAATAVAAGLVALPDRSSLLAMFPAPSAEVVERMTVLLGHAEEASAAAIATGCAEAARRVTTRRVFAHARRWDRSVRGCSVTDDELAEIAVGLCELPTRDAVWLAIDAGRLDGGALWRHVAAQVPAPYDAAPLLLAAWGMWRQGNGPAADVALDRLLAGTPGYSAARMLRVVLRAGVDPRRLPPLRLPSSA